MDHPITPEENLIQLLQSPSYRLAYRDRDFMAGPRLRAARMELEMLKPELTFSDYRVRSTVVVFGSTQIVDRQSAEDRLRRARTSLQETPNNPRRQRAVDRAERILAKADYYEKAHRFATLVSSINQEDPRHLDFVIVTGGGPGIMEAANRGAFEIGGKSIGLNIRLPHEQAPNAYITPELCFQFHYFAIRKFHFLLRAKALVVFPGGFGTLDELFDALTLRQTGRLQDIPIIIFGREYWEHVIDFQYLADEGTLDDADLDLFRYVDTPEEAWDAIKAFHRLD